MADKTELRMNLAAIKRVDPYAKDIIDSSAHVAFYTFNPDETEWEKTDVEGAFFVYSRNAEPYHSIFINNRLNTNSLVEPITAHIELQSQPPFLLYRNERSRIRGFWFYDRSECDRIGELVERIVKDCDTTGKPSGGQTKGGNATSVPAPTATSATSTTGIFSGSAIDKIRYEYLENSNVDIFSMLSKAQQDFNNSLSTPGGPAGKNAPVQLGPAQLLNLSAAHVISNGGGNAAEKQIPHSVPIAVPPKTVADGTSQSVMNFFAAAKPATTKPKEAPFLQRMLSAPVRITCDQIEKQQRVTPHNEKQSPPQQAPFAESSEIENGFGFMRIHSPSQQQRQTDLGASPLATFIGAANNMSGGTANVLDSGKHATKEHDLKEPLQELLKKPAPILAASLVNSTNTTPHKPALMPPTMFKSTLNTTPGSVGSPASKSTTNATNAKNTNNSNSNNAVTTNNVHSVANAIKKEPLSTPNSNYKSQKRNAAAQHQQQSQQTSVGGGGGAGSSSSGGGGGSIGAAAHKPTITKPEPLTQTQLLQAMSYLIKNDPDFVRKIHEAYLKSFTEMVSL